jgi:hypothetical protein
MNARGHEGNHEHHQNSKSIDVVAYREFEFTEFRKDPPIAGKGLMWVLFWIRGA